MKCPKCNKELEVKWNDTYSKSQKLIAHYRHEHFSWYVWSRIEAITIIKTDNYKQIRKSTDMKAIQELLKLPLNRDIREELKEELKRF